jgi:hypothetical protein
LPIFPLPAGVPIKTAKAAQGLSSLHRRSCAQAMNFPIDYCRENRYNELQAQIISAV